MASWYSLVSVIPPHLAYRVSPTPTRQARRRPALAGSLIARPTTRRADLVACARRAGAAAGPSPTASRGPGRARPGRSPTGPSSGCSSSTKWPRAAQVAVVEDLLGGPDHAPGQAGALAQAVEGLAVVLLGQPLEGPPDLAVVGGPVTGVGEGGVRQRRRPRPRPRASRASRRTRAGPRKSGLRAATWRPSAAVRVGCGPRRWTLARAQVRHEVPLGHRGRALVGRDVDELALARLASAPGQGGRGRRWRRRSTAVRHAWSPWQASGGVS